ncbi:hypothetical protein LG943_22410 [Streptomonospora sp. S1-112]|uniref:Uncharacterized protein n=1 Tax=Streptomonospora mangrovi TaxID=2883123 RepID=A0A9X3NRH2_9ACTN|nr:hypothetical protein [Streptomonospora mangrovi]MDA0567048.1 hypothetical protein [Streptomonospora mangrovi]
MGQGHGQGQGRRHAESLLIFLDARGLEVSDTVRERITTCHDPDQLITWVRRAATVDSAEDLFA